MTQIGNILHKLSPHDKLNILTFDTHERYQQGMCLTGHNFYSVWFEGIKKWNTKYGEVPNNYHILWTMRRQLPDWLNFDLILSQNKFGQFQAAQKLAAELHLPIVSLEHTLPMPGWPQSHLDMCGKMRGAINVFISNYSLEGWQWEDKFDTQVIGHMVDTSIFKPPKIENRQNHILTVANDYIGRDWCLNFSQYKAATNGLPTRPVGDTPGFSQPAPNIYSLIQEYQTSRIFLNTAHISPIPTSLLEAAACGCALVSCRSCAIPEYFTHGHDILFADSDEEMCDHLQQLLTDEKLAETLGKNAAKTIQNKCAPELFTSKWHQVFEIAKQTFYTI